MTSRRIATFIKALYPEAKCTSCYTSGIYVSGIDPIAVLDLQAAVTDRVCVDFHYRLYHSFCLELGDSIEAYSVTVNKTVAPITLSNEIVTRLITALKILFDDCRILLTEADAETNSSSIRIYIMTRYLDDFDTELLNRYLCNVFRYQGVHVLCRGYTDVSEGFIELQDSVKILYNDEEV